MTKEEILKASEELQERVDGKRTENPHDPSLSELLGKAMDYIFKRDEEKIEKSETEQQEETAREEAVRKAEGEGEEGFYKGIVESPVGEKMQDMIDASPVLEGFTDQIAKSMGAYEAIKKAQTEQNDRLATMEVAMGAILKSHEAIYALMQDVKDQPVTRTNPGVVLSPTGRDSVATGDVPPDLRERVLKSVQKGNLDPKYYSWFDTRTPEEIFAALPEGALE